MEILYNNGILLITYKGTEEEINKKFDDILYTDLKYKDIERDYHFYPDVYMYIYFYDQEQKKIFYNILIK